MSRALVASSTPPTPASDAAPPIVPSSDVCRPVSDARDVPGWIVFLGEFVASRDDDESGYAHALRWYSFKPVQAWRGPASAEEISGAWFIPDASDPSPHVRFPNLRRGQHALVVMNRGGLSGKMPVITEVIPREAARARIEALGLPCWTR